MFKANSKDILFSRKKTETNFQNFINFPLVRILIAILFITPVVQVRNLISIFVLDMISDPLSIYLGLLLDIILFVGILYSYRFYTTKIESRDAYEFSTHKSIFDTAIGFSFMLMQVILLVLILWFNSAYNIESTSSFHVLVKALYMFGLGALLQEIIFRQIIFQKVEEFVGTWLAILSIGLIFGGAHLLNEKATIVSCLFLMLSDVFFTAVFIYTRRIWVVWGLHWGWNFAQDGLFGMPNSGIDTLDSWITPIISGPEWLTGGSFGLEASYPSFIIGSTLGIIMIYVINKDKMINKPVWKR